jgi:hypothetical protein
MDQTLVTQTYSVSGAGHDISRNMMPSEMNHEQTPNGEVYTHASGFKFLVKDNDVVVFDANGEEVGAFKSLDEAVAKAIEKYRKDFPEDKPIPSFDNIKAEIVKPQFESREDYIHNRILSEYKGRNGIELSRLISFLEYSIKKTKENIDGLELQPAGKELLRINLEEKTRIVEFLKGERKMTPEEFSKSFKKLNDMDTSEIGARASSTIETIQKYLGGKWDKEYPMKFRSPLDDAIKSWFADGKTMTAQQLLKKLLRVGSSKGIQVWTEANNIGLIKHLKSKIKPTEHIHRTINPETGNYYPRGTPDAPVIKTYSGEQQVPLNRKEILKFMDENRIVLTIEQDAKEVSGLHTETYTADGEREGYRETALRINPQYRHGITGHYDQAVAHLRTTDRVDSEGERTNYMEESQANNTDSTTRSVSPAELKQSHDKATKENKLIDNGQLIQKIKTSEENVDNGATSVKNQTTDAESVEDAIDQLIASSRQTTDFYEAFSDYTDNR